MPFLKHDTGKPPLSLLPRAALVEAAKALQYGSGKYSKYNHLQGADWSRWLDSALRHLYAWADREDLDSESGLSHLSHALGCLMVLSLYEQESLGTDDRRPVDQGQLPDSDDIEVEAEKTLTQEEFEKIIDEMTAATKDRTLRDSVGQISPLHPYDKRNAHDALIWGHRPNLRDPNDARDIITPDPAPWPKISDT